MKRILLLIIITTATVFSQSKVGTTAANFLTIPVGPRASSIGGAFVAIANDATAIYWNPGGLARMPQSEFTVSYTEWLVNTKFNWIGISYKLSDNSAFAVSVNQLDYGSEEITTVEQPNGTGQNWDAQDLAISVTYSQNLTDRFSIGGSLKYISQSIWNESASAYALDIGLLFYTQLQGLRLGMNISNFGTEMKLAGKDLLQTVDINPSQTGNNDRISANLDTDSWTLPLNFTIGLAMDVMNNEMWNVVVATDAVYPNNHTSFLNVGTEIIWNDLISLRAGYNSLFKEAAEEGLTAGIGLKYDFGGINAKVDYSYTDFGIFNNISRFSLAIGF